MKKEEDFTSGHLGSSSNRITSNSELGNNQISEIINNNRMTIVLVMIGLTLIGLGIFYLNVQESLVTDEIVLLDDKELRDVEKDIIFVEIAGAVEKPGVYQFSADARIEDLLIKSGGLSKEANRDWVEKFVNRASLLSDGMKLYIPDRDEQLDAQSANKDALYQNDTNVLSDQGSTIVNINTATKSELEELWGIGPVYAQNIIDNRPYSSVEELLEKGVIKTNVYERNKELITVF